MNIENTPGPQSPDGRESQEDTSPDLRIDDAQDALDHDQHRDSELVPEVRAPETTVPVSEHQTAELQEPTTETMAVYLERLETEYRKHLAGQFALWLGRLNAAEIAFILSDNDLRNNVAHSLKEYGVEQNTLGIGEYVETAYVAHHPRIAQRAMELAARARQVNESFQAQAAEIARTTGSLHLPEPVKDAHRIAEKMERDYGDEQRDTELDIDLLASLVKDAVRCRLVVGGDPIIVDEPIIRKIGESGLTIAEDNLHNPLIKRGFRDRHTGEPLDIESGTRYRDTKVTVIVTVEVPTRDGATALCEIAIVTPEMAAATVSEHPIYEITRSLEGDDNVAAARLLSSLNEIQEGFYNGVSRQISERVSTI